VCKQAGSASKYYATSGIRNISERSAARRNIIAGSADDSTNQQHCTPAVVGGHQSTQVGGTALQASPASRAR
jgi:hypothetical protein